MKGAIEVERVSKCYRLGVLGTLRGTLSAILSRGSGSDDASRMLWALRDVSFRVEPGKSLALIGPNGAGKTTALKLLSNVTRPTSGRITVHGRMSSLIELGAGFHPELTGRENIYLNGAILGLRKHEIARRLDAIIAFSELERFIDTPVKRYSSGMYVRLGFAVAAHVEPDVLLVDEVLAVGDTRFRNRCLGRIRDLQRNGTTVVFVSHNMHMIRDVCESALLLMNGCVCAAGKPHVVIAEYEKRLIEANSVARNDTPLSASDSSGSLILTKIDILSADPSAQANLSSYLPATVRIGYRAVLPQSIGRLVLVINREDGTLCTAADASLSAPPHVDLRELCGQGVIEVTFDPLQLVTGRYFAEVLITDVSDSMVIASGRSQRFSVYGEVSRPHGIYLPRVRWGRQDIDSDGTERA